MLELSGSIWMAVTVHRADSSKRSLLKSILLYCRSMFSYFFHPLNPLNTISRNEKPLPEIISKISESFPFIVGSIDWIRLDFTYLYESIIKQHIHNNINELHDLCQNLLIKESNLFDNILILYRKHRVIYSTFSKDITKALSFGMRKKFQYLYLHKPFSSSETFHWLIGLYINPKGISSVYQQPIYYNGSGHLFVAFKYHKFKIVLTNPNNLELNDSTFKKMPEKLKDILKYLKNCYPKRPVYSPYPFAKSFFNGKEGYLDSISDQIDSHSRHIIHSNFIKIHDLALYLGITSTIALPVKNNFSIICKKNDIENTETIIAVQCEKEKVSEYLDISLKLIDPKQINQNSNDCFLI